MADDKIEIRNLEDIEGSECLVPPSSLRPSEAARVAALAQGLEDESFEAIIPMLELVEEKYVADEKAYQDLYAETGLAGVIELVVAWLGELVAAQR